MFRRGLALCAVLGFASVANAGAVVELVPSNIGTYFGGETFTVDIKLTQSGGSNIPLRGQRYDFNASSSAILMNSFAFEFAPANGGGQQLCALVPALCGSGHSNFNSLTDDDGKVVNSIFTGQAQDLLTQVVLPGTGTITVGHLNITLPSEPGVYLLDALNLAASIDPILNQNEGAALDFDFVNRTTWRAPNDLAEGSYSFQVVPEPATLVLLGLGGVAAAMRRRQTA